MTTTKDIKAKAPTKPRAARKPKAAAKTPARKRATRKSYPQRDPSYQGRDVITRFQPGNRMFCIQNLGRDHVYTNVDEFADNCASYFSWLEENPLYEAKAMSFQGSSWIEKIPKMRVATIEGVCMHIGIGVSTWKKWRSGDAPNPVFVSVIEKCEYMIREQKFSGAASGLLHPLIIARDLGLSDRIEQDHKSTDGSMSPVAQATFDPADLAKLAMELADKL